MKAILIIIISTFVTFSADLLDSIVGCTNFERSVSNDYLLLLIPVDSCNNWKIEIIPKVDQDSITKRNLCIIERKLWSYQQNMWVKLKISPMKTDLKLENDIWYVKNLNDYENEMETYLEMNKAIGKPEFRNLEKAFLDIPRKRVKITIYRIIADPNRIKFKISE